MVRLAKYGAKYNIIMRIEVPCLHVRVLHALAHNTNGMIT